MNTQGIGNSKNDAWLQFVKLTQEARLRNQNISANSKAAVNKTSISKAVNTNFQKPAAAPLTNVTFNSSVPNVKTKIVGGLFDTYA